MDQDALAGRGGPSHDRYVHCESDGDVVAFSMVFSVRQPTAAGATAEAGQLPAGEYLLHGCLSSRLGALRSLHSPLVRRSISEGMSPSHLAAACVARVFKSRVVVVNSDLHKSNYAAERQSAASTETPTSTWRCSFHRVRTAERRTLALDASTESCYSSTPHLLTHTQAAWKVFRNRLRKWAVAKLVVMPAPPPPPQTRCSSGEQAWRPCCSQRSRAQRRQA